MTMPSPRTLVGVLAAVAIAGVGFGITLPLLSILLERAGTSSTLIGLSTAMNGVASLVAVPFVPAALRRWGAARLLIACLLAIAVTLILMRAWVNVWFWFPVRFVLGAALAALFTASEFWINAMANEKTRGRLVGLYAMIFSAGWAAGPLLLGALGAENWEPVMAACTLLALAVVPLALVRADAPKIGEERPPALWAIVRSAPAISLAAFVFGGVELGVFALLPVYALGLNLSLETGTAMLTALAVGNIALQYPIGWLADRMDRRLLLFLCATAGLAGAVSLPLVIGVPVLLYGTLFLWGGVVVGLYTLSLILLGERFKGPNLATANAAVVLLYAMGGLVTPPVSGLAMDLWPPHGLTLVLGLLCGGYALMVAGGAGRRPASTANP